MTIDLEPTAVKSPSVLLSEGYQHHLEGNLPLAEEAYRNVLTIDPHHAEAINLLGIIAMQVGKPEASTDYFQTATQIHEAKANFYNDLGILLNVQGLLNQAASCYQIASLYNPNLAQTHSNLGAVYQSQGLLDLAFVHYQKALQLNPQFMNVYRNMGTALELSGRLQEAEHCLEEVLRQEPQAADAYNSLGSILHKQGRYDEALAHYQTAIDLSPNYPDPYNNRGVTLQALGKLEEAMANFDHALTLRPNYIEATVNRSLVFLQGGDFLQGWELFEHRFALPRFFPKRSLTKPVWDGAALNGERILVVAEQGYGDTFQFLRYLPLIQEKGGKVIYACPPELEKVLTGCQGIDELVILPPEGLPDVACDLNVFLMSLPHLFKTTVETIPAVVKSLQADPAMQQKWQQRFSKDKNTKIGIAWSGNPENPTNFIRSCPVERFTALLNVPKKSLYALQKGGAAQEFSTLTPRKGFDSLEAELADFSDTAAAIEQLDLIVTVDTAIAHLAGILKKPVWLLLPYGEDWRWLLDRKDSPWYPTMRIFHQPSPEDWASVFQEVTEALREFRA